VQGSWLDWPSLKLQLLGEVADILPEADLQPVRAEDAEDPSRDLASLPVRLVVNRSPASATSASSALRWSLSVIWAALAVALLAAAALLGGVLALSERRAAFVSSVTHELRTPLTTFRMYADMLARDMVPTATRRKEYMETLRREAERLTNLVENVLSYARLERGRKPQRNDRTTIGAMLERFESRLYDRAEQADMQLVLQIDDDATRANVLTDAGVVEQILFNLVDNAAKYAGRASDRRIHVEALRSSDYVEITVRDHGPGFADPRDAERAKAFQKSAQQAAETAPGVGLGLALCRRLAGEVGGRLKAGSSNSGEPGARVTLGLPVER
jgi:signal transduction histidine kinase